ncbi:MAG: 3D-(3,5/4)-trihydroxycyclohexane-1,2-dione acylhydrolase (decyclizing) [Deltaproteobacteria bacterium]|nr:3D-(3,5/4)-trihydroxycyclohexane-1,2-dione acylhydrolase (decyclizing) [Deltaproteobacteria bacterium]
MSQNLVDGSPEVRSAGSLQTVRLTVACALLRFLKAQRVRRDGVEAPLFHGVFGIFGHGNVAGLGQALDEEGGLPHYQPKNEQAGVHAAIAFAKHQRRLGVMAVTTSVGPGATNLVTGAATATINRLPVLLLPGDTFANRRPQPVLQQLEHPSAMDLSVNDCLRPVSRYWDRIVRPEQLLLALPEAVRVLLDPADTGAVTLCLPEDVQAEAVDWPAHFFEPRVHGVERRPPGAESLAAAVEVLKKAKRPLLIAGGGVHYSDAFAALRALCDATGIPVAMTQAGTGALPASHRSWLGSLGVTGTECANAIARDADVVLCVGTRLSDFTTASKTQLQHPAVRFVSVNVNAFDAHKHGAVPVVADARLALAALTEALPGTRYAEEPVAQARAAWQATRATLVRPLQSGALSQAELLDVLNQRAGAGSTVVHAAGGIPGDIHKLWASVEPRDYHSEYGYSCMGYEVAGALGVKLAEPAREVYALLGDGSYLMMANELLTSVQEGRKIVVILVDNHGYQCIHNLQRGCGGRSFGNEFRARTGAGLTGEPVAVDFVKNAASLGAVTFTAKTRAELTRALDDAARVTTSCLIYVPLEAPSRLPGSSWWDVPVAEHSTQPDAQRARAEYEGAASKRRFFW